MLTSLLDKYVRKSPVLSYSPLVKEGSKQDWRNKPTDWSDIRKDCPANSIALYAAQSSIYTKVGNPTIEKGIVSGFSTGNYVKPASNVPFSRASSWEFISRFKVQANTTGNHFLADFAAEAKGFNINVTSTSIWWELGNASASNWQYSKLISYTFNPTMFYSVKLSFDGNLYSIWLKTDITQWTKLDEYASTTSVGTSYYNAFGYSIRFNGREFKGSIDLNETHIKVNGSELVNSSAYDNLGFTANCTGGYKVFIDGTQYGKTYASGTTCPITWSKYNPNLPYGYTQLEYLQTDGASYIDTGVIGKGNATTFDFAYSSSNDDRAVFGARQASNVRMFEFAQLVGSGGRFDYNNSTASLDFGASVKHICKTKIDGSYYTVERYNSDGVLQNSYNFTLNNFETPYTLDLFARNNNGTVNAFSTDAKIYYFKIYEDGVLIRNFIPCKNSSNVLGMYDTVNDVFYENEGTGDFIAGNEIIPGTKGDIITTPSLMVAHKIWIEPATEGNNITAFSCRRVASSGQEFQGLLWEHFNITNAIVLNNHTNLYNNYRNSILVACTAKNNNLKVSNLTSAFWSCIELSYVPIIDLNNNTLDFSNSFARTKVKNIIFKNGTISNLSSTFEEAGIEKIKSNSLITNASSLSKSFKSATSVIDFDKLNINWTNVTDATDFIYNSKQIKDTVLDTRAGTSLKKIGCYASSNTYFIQGFKGLRVSNEAPFDNATSPQINVSYTNMDKNAIVTLFNDLPTVSSGQIINITGCTGAMSLNGDDISIATNKGWTVVGGPALSTYYKYTNEQEGNIYTKDAAAKDGSVFTIDNISTVGNMRVENELCSNFSSSNYLKLDQAFNPGSSHWEITLKYKTGTSGSARYLFDSCKGLGQNGRFGLCIFISSDSHFTINNTFNGNDWSITSSNGGKGTYTVLANTDYWIKVGWDGTKYYLKYSLTGNDNDYTEDISFSSTTATYAQLAYSYIGVYSSTSFDNPLNGTIDLSQTYYTIGNTTTNFGTFDTTSVLYNSSFEEFNPQPDFTVTNGFPINTQIVGSSLFENNGVYSNFSDTSFIRLGTHNFGSAFSFKTRAKIVAYTSSSQVIMSGRDYDYEGGNSYFNIYITSSYKWGFELGTGNDSTWSISETSNVTATVDETYDIIFCYEEGYYRVKVSVAGQDNYTTVCEQASASQIMVNSIPVVLGINKSYLYYHGSIDIKETELTIDGVTTTYWDSIPYITMDNQEYDYSGTVQH